MFSLASPRLCIQLQQDYKTPAKSDSPLLSACAWQLTTNTMWGSAVHTSMHMNVGVHAVNIGNDMPITDKETRLQLQSIKILPAFKSMSRFGSWLSLIDGIVQWFSHGNHYNHKLKITTLLVSTIIWTLHWIGDVLINSQLIKSILHHGWYNRLELKK